MTNEEFNSIKKTLSTPKRIVIVPHKNPDGDAIGSTLGLYLFLKEKGHNAIIISPNDYPEFLKWMPGEDSIMNFETDTAAANELISKAELIFTLDFNALNRVGSMEESLSSSEATFIMIDHHQQPDNYAHFTYSDPNKSSTCEMVYNFIINISSHEDITKDIASCLYSGIVTDTGSFRFSSTSSETHRIVANLIDKGINNSEIHNNIYDNNSIENLQLLGIALSNLHFLPEYNTAYITLTQEQLNRFNFKKGDTEGFVNYGLSLKGVVFAAIFIENSKENLIKISFRSKGEFSVNKFARKHFKGGGHTNAAGGKSENSLENTIEKFISILPDYKSALNR